MDAKKNSLWNHHPDLPIPLSPILSWPPRPVAWIRWITRYGLAISSVTLELAAAFAVYRWFQPDWTTMQSLAPGWVFAIWARNMVLLTLVAGGLHLWFVTLKAQAARLEFDRRDQVKDNGAFSFRDQVWDNMFWSYASGVSRLDRLGGALFLGRRQRSRAAGRPCRTSGLVRGVDGDHPGLVALPLPLRRAEPRLFPFRFRGHPGRREETPEHGGFLPSAPPPLFSSATTAPPRSRGTRCSDRSTMAARRRPRPPAPARCGCTGSDPGQTGLSGSHGVTR